MFSKSNQEKSDLNNLPDISDNLNSEIIDQEQIKTVKLVEKISSILSPYFIVIVGLYLSDDSFIIGFILIVVGILSLLKISYQDIISFAVNIKDIFKKDN